MSTLEAKLVQQGNTGTLGWLCWCSKILEEHWDGCVVTAEYYMSPWEAVLVQQNNIGALGRLCWYSRVLLEHPVGSFGTPWPIPRVRSRM